MKICRVLIFVTLVCLSVIKTQNSNACTSIRPNQPSDCNILSNNNYYCCYRTDDLQTSKSCVYIQKSLYTPSQYFLNGIGYNQDCGISAQIRPVNTGQTLNTTGSAPIVTSLPLPYQTCGISNPIYAKDCTDYSVFGNSCCFFQKGLSSGCYWLGQRFVGNQTVLDYEMSCSAQNLTSKLFFFIIIIAMLFI